MGVPVEAKMRATDKSVPSPPRTITSPGACSGIRARSMAGAAVVYCPPSRSSSGS